MEPRTGIPVNCVALMLVSVICLSTAILTENWFSKINAVCSTISNGFLFTYGTVSNAMCYGTVVKRLR